MWHFQYRGKLCTAFSHFSEKIQDFEGRTVHNCLQFITVTDPYGRKIPKHAHGTATLTRKTSSVRCITDAVLDIYDSKVDPKLTVRRLTITANRLVGEDTVQSEIEAPAQFSLFDDVAEQERQAEEEKMRLERERKLQEAMLGIKQKFGKNAILSGGSYMEGATARERNGQIGGHKA